MLSVQQSCTCYPPPPRGCEIPFGSARLIGCDIFVNRTPVQRLLPLRGTSMRGWGTQCRTR